MRRFKMNTWGGKQRTITAETVTFGPAHVIFSGETMDGYQFIYAAIRNEDVNDLQEIGGKES